MTTINLNQDGDTLVLHIRKEGHTINAYSLASTLVSIADAAKAANAEINPGYDIEVVVEALSDGSVKATLKAVYRSLGNLFSKNAVQAIVLGVLTNYIYENTLAPSKDISIIVNTDEVIIQQNDRTIIVPRTIYDATQKVKGVEQVQKKVGQAVDALLQDEEITGLSIDPDSSKDKEREPITREELEAIAIPPDDTDNSRAIEEVAELQIIRAILEKSRRRWEFSWKGFRIPAPILHEDFYKQFSAHKIVIGPGDTLKARLRIYQSRDPANDVFVNERYEVVEVLEHISARKHHQQEL